MAMAPSDWTNPILPSTSTTGEKQSPTDETPLAPPPTTEGQTARAGEGSAQPSG
jgi:hypothetical protein